MFNYFCRMSNSTKSWMLLLTLACIWGSSFILMKKGMFTADGGELFSAPQVGALRMLIASSVLLPFSIRAIRKIQNKKDLLFFSIVGFSGNFFPAFLFTYAETGISSGFAGMLNSFTPIFTIIIGYVIYKQRITSFQVAGTIIGTIGIILLINAGKSVSLNASIFHVLAVVLATFLYGVSLTTIKNKLQHYSSVDITSLAFLTVFVPALFAFFIFETPSVILENEHALEGLMYISILAIFGTAMAVFLFNGILRMSSALFASSVTYFIPIVAVIIGFFFKESLSWGQVISMFIVLIGVVTANYGHLIINTKKTS